MDKLRPAERSALMARVRGKDTKPEMIVRRLAYAMGLRYRLHRRDLPGQPDLTFPRLRRVIFVHGCFWHGHSCRAGRNRPGTNRPYWIPKLDRNARRDRSNRAKLRRLGWRVLTIWECQLRHLPELRRRLDRFFEND